LTPEQQYENLAKARLSKILNDQNLSPEQKEDQVVIAIQGIAILSLRDKDIGPETFSEGRYFFPSINKETSFSDRFRKGFKKESELSALYEVLIDEQNVDRAVEIVKEKMREWSEEAKLVVDTTKE